MDIYFTTGAKRNSSVTPFKEFQSLLLDDLYPSLGEVDLYLHMAASMFLLVNIVPVLNTETTHLALSVSLLQFHWDNFLAIWNSFSKHRWRIYCKIPLSENWNIMVSESTEKDNTVSLEKEEKLWTCIGIARSRLLILTAGILPQKLSLLLQEQLNSQGSIHPLMPLHKISKQQMSRQMHLSLSYPRKQMQHWKCFLFKITFENCVIAVHGINYIVNLMAYLKTRNIDLWQADSIVEKQL